MICFSCVLRDLGFSVVFLFIYFTYSCGNYDLGRQMFLGGFFIYLFIAVVTMAPPYRKINGARGPYVASGCQCNINQHLSDHAPYWKVRCMVAKVAFHCAKKV